MEQQEDVGRPGGRGCRDGQKEEEMENEEEVEWMTRGNELKIRS